MKERVGMTITVAALITVAVYAGVMLLAGSAEAANLTDEGMELPLDKESSNNLVQMPSGIWVLQIDDMLIPVDSGAKSGSCCTQWTSGVVYYQFDANLSVDDGRPLSGNAPGRRAAFRMATAAWESSVPGLSFVEGPGAGYYIHVQSANGNSSYLGMIALQFQPQTMNIYNWDYVSVIAHEIGHALGLVHEQSRSDRDTYVSVAYANIQDDREFNYDKDLGSTAHGSYDYDSVMHYGRCSFWDDAAGTCGVHGYTMDAVAVGAALVGMSAAEAEAAMGQRYHLSVGDVAGVNAMYPAAASSLWSDGFETASTGRWSSIVP